MSHLPIPPSQERDEETLKLLKHLFNELIKEEGLTPVRAADLLPEYLLQWIESKINVGVINESVVEEAQVKPIAWEFLKEILGNAAGVLMIAPLWPMVTLAYRGDPKYKVKSLHSVYLITYEDGRICPIFQLVHADLMSGGAINDAFAATQTYRQFREVQNNVIGHGLDGLHDKVSGDFGGSNFEDFFNVVMGILLTGIQARPPAEQQTLMLWMRLIQRILNTPIPAEVRAKLEARKRMDELAKEMPRPPGPVGGFDS